MSGLFFLEKTGDSEEYLFRLRNLPTGLELLVRIYIGELLADDLQFTFTMSIAGSISDVVLIAMRLIVRAAAGHLGRDRRLSRH